jgi:hypothetical protein
MPPWGAIKGFGQFRNDQSLTPEQIELITKWVDGGIRRGNNPRLLPKEPVFEASAEPPVPKNAFRFKARLRCHTTSCWRGLTGTRAVSAVDADHRRISGGAC